MDRELSHSRDDSAEPKGVIRAIARAVWLIIRAPIYMVLAILEPFVSLVLSLLVVIALFAVLISHFVVHAAHFPLGFAIGFMLASAFLLALYHGLMALLAR